MRADLTVVARMVPPGARVLDLGCGDGDLLAELIGARGCRGQGVEVSPEAFHACLMRGIPVVQADIDAGLPDFEDGAFDVVVLSQTLQATRNPRLVLEQMLRIGRHAIVSFPNFGHWRVRSSLFFSGRMPVTENLNHAWYDTPNIHFCTIRDFVALLDDIPAKIDRAVALNASGGEIGFNAPWWLWNLVGEQAVFLIRRT